MRTIFSVLTWIAINFVLPAALVIIGVNIFLWGAGINFRIDPNSLTFLGIILVRLALPVTKPQPQLRMVPLADISEDDPELREFEQKLKGAINEARRQQQNKDKDDSSGPSDKGSS